MLVRGLFRTLKLCLESSTARQIPEDHALVPWLLLHTCLHLTTAVKGSDGLTAWHRARGRKFHGKLACFGTQILYKFHQKALCRHCKATWGTCGNRPAIYVTTAPPTATSLASLEESRPPEAYGDVRKTNDGTLKR